LVDRPIRCSCHHNATAFIASERSIAVLLWLLHRRADSDVQPRDRERRLSAPMRVGGEPASRRPDGLPRRQRLRLTRKRRPRLYMCVASYDEARHSPTRRPSWLPTSGVTASGSANGSAARCRMPAGRFRLRHTIQGSQDCGACPQLGPLTATGAPSGRTQVNNADEGGCGAHHPPHPTRRT
jgi:hypothetical protein